MKTISTMRKKAKSSSDTAARAVLRALRIIEILLACPEGMALGEVSQKAKLGASTAHRLLAALVQAGFAEQEGRRSRYRIARRFAAAAAGFAQGLDLVGAAQPVMKRLAEQFNETVHLSVLDGDEALDLHAVESTHSLRVCNPPGGRFPIHTSSTGKVLLAWAPDEVKDRILAMPLRRYTSHTIATARALQQELERVRKCNYAVDNREYDPHTWCAAAPVRDQAGRCVAALGLSAVASRITAAQRKSVCRAVLAAAAEVSYSLGCPALAGPQATLKRGAA